MKGIGQDMSLDKNVTDAAWSTFEACGQAIEMLKRDRTSEAKMVLVKAMMTAKHGSENPDGEVYIFHGMCHGCTQQILKGIDFCSACQGANADWTRPDWNNSRGESETEVLKRHDEERKQLMNIVSKA
jgi:hypothetical protein